MDNEKFEVHKGSFANLKNFVFAEYGLIFKYGDSNICTLLNLKDTSQFEFIKFSNQLHEVNLVMIDGCFPQLVSELALLALVGKNNLCLDFFRSRNKLILKKSKQEDFFWRYKFQNLFYHYLYSNVSKREIFTGNIDTRKIYCLRDKPENEIKFYSVYEQNALLDIILENVHIEIVHELSFIKAGFVKLYLKIYYN